MIVLSLLWKSLSKSATLLRRLGGDSKELSEPFEASFGGMNLTFEARIPSKLGRSSSVVVLDA